MPPRRAVRGHVNNVTFSVFFEAGRVDLLYASATSLVVPGAAFVLARSYVDFIGQLNWPGQVLIGTRVVHVGRSSIRLAQALFQQEVCAAVCDCVMVMVRSRTGGASPLGKKARAFLNGS
jgi:acyl-CoA thioester hydrolase